MVAAHELQSRDPDLIKEELANDRPAFRADIVTLGADETVADEIASTVDATIITGAISYAAKSDVARINLLQSELDYTEFLLARDTAWRAQADGSLIFDSSADLRVYQEILARISAALIQMAGGDEKRPTH